MSQKLVRVDDTAFAVVDEELALVMAGDSSIGHPCLIGLAFRTVNSGWRCLRMGAVDVGHRPTYTQAVDRILQDWRRDNDGAALDPRTRQTLPL